MCLFVIVLNCCCMCVGGRVFTDYAVVFLLLDQGPDYLLILEEWRGWQIRCCQQLSVSPKMKGVLGSRAGARAAVSAAVNSEVQGKHLALPVFQRRQLPMWKMCKSQRIKRWKGAVRIIIMLDSSIWTRIWGHSYLFCLFPWAHPNYLSFSYTHLCQTELPHICCKTTHGISVYRTVLKLVCFMGKDTRAESKWSRLQSWCCDRLAMGP